MSITLRQRILMTLLPVLILLCVLGGAGVLLLRQLGESIDVTRLRLLDQVKSNLVATASHELKTPLTSVRLAVHLLLEASTGPLTPKQTELLLDARENSERLLTMVNNLLDLARLEQGWRQLDALPESPGSLLRAAADALRARANDKNVEVVVTVSEGLPAVAVDRERLGHAFRNLLDNALAYTDTGGRIMHIVLGRTLRRWFGQSLLDRLLQAVPETDVLVVGRP